MENKEMLPIIYFGFATPVITNTQCLIGLICHSIDQCLESSEVKRFQTLLMIQWWGICLPMPWTQVWSLVWEDPTCHGPAKTEHHSYWVSTLEPWSHNYWAHTLWLLNPMCLEPVLCNKRNHRNERPPHSN